jgi:hypothetical protein
VSMRPDCRNCGEAIYWNLDSRQWEHDVRRALYCAARDAGGNPVTKAEADHDPWEGLR